MGFRQKLPGTISRLICLASLLFFFALPSITALAAPAVTSTTIEELASRGKDFHGQLISFQGEAIGDLINSSDGRIWLTLRDQRAAIGVIIDVQMAAQISNLGRYQVEGTTVEITGVFHLACDEHDGPTDVHATSLTVVSPGGVVPQTFNFNLLLFGLVLALAGGILTIVYRLLVERSR